MGILSFRASTYFAHLAAIMALASVEAAPVLVLKPGQGQSDL
jgi:hypothetical protein